VPVLRPYRLAGREFHPEDSLIRVRDYTIGGREVHVIAGPCAVESRDQMLETAFRVKEAGATLLRGGAYKPRTSPYSFQGLEEEGLKILEETKLATGLPVVTEVLDQRHVELVAEVADVLQIGARNMQNFSLLKEVGRCGKPVFLKRGASCTVEEWLLAAEYVMLSGNPNVILCERGIRTFENSTRNTLDLTAIALAKQLSHLPVFADPSHGTGKWKLVAPMARAAVACGADGLVIEVHTNPEEALSDGPQSLKPDNFASLMNELQLVARAVGRELASPPAT
ncbi:MAG: 3-deoxy-7-phosphoheptulonate synthase, partial [Clostridia bacterium]|nr:3-deoxy-7-phosphoheptulonate synthase [Clostridia bacterium]